jgi:Creatinase/Prolidase N-terminal domain
LDTGFIWRLVILIIELVGLSQEDKLTKVREELKTKKSEAVIVSMLDEVA